MYIPVLQCVSDTFMNINSPLLEGKSKTGLDKPVF